MLRGRIWVVCFVLAVTLTIASASLARSSSDTQKTLAPDGREADTAQLFDAIKMDPSNLRIFLKGFPKGGDLHNHLSGTPYAEEFIDWAGDQGLCVNREDLSFVEPPCSPPLSVPAASLWNDADGLYDEMIDVMSVRALLTGKPGRLNGHQQFFGSFPKFFPVYAAAPGRAIASSRRTASGDHVLYQELMVNPASFAAFSTGDTNETWSGDFEAEFAKLKPHLARSVQRAQADTDLAEANAFSELGCDRDPSAIGCDVTVRYNCFGLRLIPEQALFEQLAQCFALIETDPRFLGVSLVQPEDHPIAVKYYDRHMDMIAFFSTQFPAAKISLHAGELTISLVAPSALRDHIAKAIHVAGSNRIGHGVDIAYEDNSRDTLAYMAAHEIAVEINLSSNAVILGVEKDTHPIGLYRASGVPIVLSTDDLGVLRSDMTQQYELAVQNHDLNYFDLKQVARNSLQYAFLEGASLWRDATYQAYVSECVTPKSENCRQYLASSPKARLQYALEQNFNTFETETVSRPPIQLETQGR